MDSRTINCSKCKMPLPREIFNGADFSQCPSCKAELLIKTFSALNREIVKRPAESLIMEEAGCFFHPQKKAVIHCDSCGRFLCSLCDVEFDGGHFCPSCLEAGKKKNKMKNLETHRTLYDSIALYIAILPLLIFWITIITAPVSIYVAIRYWKAPGSIIPRTKARFIAAMVISGFQIAGWAFVLGKFI